ncbi:hypothetical protein M6B38_343735 [Iris pallida]|uniref:Uncharacterized protein n=1 Tax=Iris pallida TaxID=29817 RepID=A0AAX6DVI1_IRIPA|nr:hypothetical protein M6B38_224580 [Iris pallida]KAJ6832241.1 hypothetical protein M6B38_343735 [Iris pallida]
MAAVASSLRSQLGRWLCRSPARSMAGTPIGDDSDNGDVVVVVEVRTLVGGLGELRRVEAVGAVAHGGRSGP